MSTNPNDNPDSQYLCARCGHPQSDHPVYKKCAGFAVAEKVQLMVVIKEGDIKCVYVNGERVAGRKPWASENMIWRNITIDKAVLQKAMGNKAIERD